MWLGITGAGVGYWCLRSNLARWCPFPRESVGGLRKDKRPVIDFFEPESMLSVPFSALALLIKW